MPNKLVNRAKMTVSGTPGTGAITLGSASSAFLDFATAGVNNGDVVSYLIEDETNWEFGTGTYSSTGPTLTRTTVLGSSNAGSAISATSAASVAVVPLVSDIGLPTGWVFPRAIMSYSSTTVLQIVAGCARSDDDTTDLRWASILTLTTTATGANGLDVSGSRAASGTIHVFVITNGTTVSAFGSNSLNPTLPSGYTQKRRVGSIKLDGSQNIRPLLARGDWIIFKQPVVDASAVTFATASTLYTLSVPSGIILRCALAVSEGGSGNVYISDPASTDATMLSNAGTSFSTNNSTADVIYEVCSNSSSQVRMRTDGASTANGYIFTYAYEDKRDV